MSHLDEGLLHAMLDGEIGSAELKAIEAHLAGCRECEARLVEARRFKNEAFGMITALDDQPVLAGGVAAAAPALVAADLGRRTGIGKNLPTWAPGLAWAATIVAAIGLGWSLRIRELPAPAALESTTQREAAARPAAAIPAPAAVAAAERRAPPLEVRRDRLAANDEVRGSALGARRSANGEVEPAKTSLAAPAAPAAPAADELLISERRESARNSISADQAIEALGGSIRLVDGLTPVRFERIGGVVRVVYETSFGLMILEQWRAANVVSHRLIAPRSAPVDSVSAWTERIR